ncbi:MAG: hypothetical protein LBH84_00020 [Prevotellaceae bacterium]|jgi:hypothetical protein|nr:hypothetical protein [Prevotellaceae bacterium]
MSNYQIGEDGFIFFIGDDGTIHRVGKIDSQGNIEGNAKKGNAGWIVLLALLIGLGITSIYFYAEMDSYSSRYYSERNENYNLRQQVENSQSGNDRTISNLRNEIRQKEYTISNLKSQLPQSYKVSSSQAYCYVLCAGSYENINCYYSYGAVLDIYYTQQGYGLTLGGWIRMSDLEEY